MVNRDLNEEELLKKAENAPSNVLGSTLSAKEKGVVREDGYVTQTPAELNRENEKDQDEI